MSGIKIDKKNRTGELILSSSHSVVIGHKPSKITPELLSKQLTSENNSTSIERFGLWDASTPNYATYYPDVTAEDLNPKEEEFILPVFRMLSETIVSKGYRPIDFSKKGVLKASMSMLLGQTINIDHEIAVGNAIGSVAEVYWQESYKTTDGVTVPAGINGVFKIDGKSNPRISRGIMMHPPSIHSNSVTVRFQWEPSHKVENMEQFYNKLGTFDKDGNMYRLVVTKVLSYSETSLVSHGADPWAQKVKDNGEINNAKYAERISFNKDGEIRGFTEFDFKNELSLSSDEQTILDETNNNQLNNFEQLGMEELLEQFVQEFGFKEGELTGENLVSKVKERLTAMETSKNTLETEKTNLSSEIERLKTENSNLTEKNEQLSTVEKQTREEAGRLYKLAKGEEADENVISMIATSELKVVTSLLKDYRKEVEEKFTESCKDCGGTNINRASAKSTKEGLIVDDNKDGDGHKKPKTSSEVLSSMKGKNKKKSRIFNN